MDKSALVEIVLKTAVQLEDAGVIMPASIRVLTALYGVKFRRGMSIGDIQGEYAAKLESSIVG